MQYVITLDEESFDRIRDHETDRICLDPAECVRITGKENAPFFGPMDDLKVYRAGERKEAVRLEILEEEVVEAVESADLDKEIGSADPENETGSRQVSVAFELKEWMINIEMEIDRQLAEEQELLRSFGIDLQA